MRSDRVPCDGDCGLMVRKDVDWLYLFNVKVYCCDDCATSRFDALYDQISFDWWERELRAETDQRKREIIKKLGSLSPSAMKDVLNLTYKNTTKGRAIVVEGRRG